MHEQTEHLSQYTESIEMPIMSNSCTQVPIVYLGHVKASGLEKHVIYITHQACVPLTDITIEHTCIKEHPSHVGHTAGVERADIPLEAGSVEKHAAHVGD